MISRLHLFAYASLRFLAFKIAIASAVVAAEIETNAFASLSALDVSNYEVQNPGEGYFDVVARRTYLQNATSPELRNWIDEIAPGVSCKTIMNLPAPDHTIALPGFYADNQTWRRMVQVFLTYEDALSALAAAELVVGDGYHAHCMVDALLQWARLSALESFEYAFETQQAWFTIESTLFASALSLMAVRNTVDDQRSADLAEIDQWLQRAALKHSAITGLPSMSCCNNHLYRRGVYAMAIGIMTEHDGLYQFGVRAFKHALVEAEGDGHLPLEIRRGRRAVHYQNFASMYLVFLAEMMERQGVNAYDMEVDGYTVRDIASVALDLMLNPSQVKQLGVIEEQILPHETDSQFLAWLEPYFARTGDERALLLMEGRRPLYNRSLGGHTSLLFYNPDSG